MASGDEKLRRCVSDVLAELIAEPRSLTEELFGRPDHLKVFVSSKMAGGVYVVERQGCAEALEATGIARAWYWERDANAGPYCSEKVCLGHAATSDGLVLIVGDSLTPITRQEYQVARERRLATFIFTDQQATQDAETQAFIASERDNSVTTKNFANPSELKSHVVDALNRFAVQSWRRTTHSTWQTAAVRGMRSA